MSNNALLVIDMLNDFVAPDGALYIGDTVKNIIPEIQKKISTYRKDNSPVLYICDNHEKDDPEFDMFPEHSVAGTRGAEVFKDLRPYDDDIIVPKKRYSGFFETDLDRTLKEQEITGLELVGVCTNICVLYTCSDARNRDYRVTVDRRCVDSFDRSAHDFALKEMDRTLGAKVV